MSFIKHPNPEEEYFTRVEAEKKRRLAEEHQRQMSEESRNKLKELHWMHCPKCGMELHTIPLRGILIDKCFACGGIFLDNGELEKLTGEEAGFLAGVLSLFRQES